jgi:enoyl-CoA hydratase
MSMSAAPIGIDDEPGPSGRAGEIRWLTINRPSALNAIDVATMQALLEAIEACAAAPALRAVIVTGAGERAFVAGADVAALAGMTPAEAGAFSRLGQRVFDGLERLSVPVIAAVNGHALGGGCELALACDFIYAATTARFGMPETRLGVIPGFGGTVRLPRRVGGARARELLFTAEIVDAAEALRLGLVNRVVEPAALRTEARRAAAAICARAPLAVAAAKQALREGADRPAAEALALEAELFGGLFATEDLRTGMRAFLDKSPPTAQNPDKSGAPPGPIWRGR